MDLVAQCAFRLYTNTHMQVSQGERKQSMSRQSKQALGEEMLGMYWEGCVRIEQDTSLAVSIIMQRLQDSWTFVPSAVRTHVLVVREESDCHSMHSCL